MVSAHNLHRCFKLIKTPGACHWLLLLHDWEGLTKPAGIMCFLLRAVPGSKEFLLPPLFLLFGLLFLGCAHGPVGLGKRIVLNHVDPHPDQFLNIPDIEVFFRLT